MGVRGLLEAVLFPPVRLDRERLRERLKGRTVVITGASFGIGRGVALLAAEAGARVVLVARTLETLEAVAAECRSFGGEALVFAADLTQADQAEDLAARLAALDGGVDVLVNNAGKSIRRSLWDSLDRFHDVTRTIGVNYLGPTRLALALIPTLRARGGQIVSISAVNVLLPAPPMWAAYQASKSAADQWLRCAAPELRSAGVAVTTLYLPLVRTRMIAPTAHYADVPAMAPEQASRLVARAILGRWSHWAPWWSPFATLTAPLLRRTAEAVFAWQMRRRLEARTQ